MWKFSLCVKKSHLVLGQHLPLFGAAFSASLPGAVPASMMAAAPAAAGGTGPVVVALLTGFGSSPSLPFPWGWARPVSAAISGPRSRKREGLHHPLLSPSYCYQCAVNLMHSMCKRICTENGLQGSEPLQCLITGKQTGESNIRKATNSFFTNADNFIVN